jgi:hypothetical protein
VSDQKWWVGQAAYPHGRLGGLKVPDQINRMIERFLEISNLRLPDAAEVGAS